MSRRPAIRLLAQSLPVRLSLALDLHPKLRNPGRRQVKTRMLGRLAMPGKKQSSGQPLQSTNSVRFIYSPMSNDSRFFRLGYCRLDIDGSKSRRAWSRV